MSARKVLFWIHLVIGCTAGAVILIMAVTGSLIAYQHDIVHWADRSLRSTPPASGARRLPMDQIIAEASARTGVTPSAITLRSDPAAPAEVSCGRAGVLLVDVYSGKILGESSPSARAFFQWTENLHRSLGTRREQQKTGRAFTGACTLVFVGLMVSGIFLWMPRKWTWRNVKAVSQFRGGLSGRARDFNWHNVVGIWSLAPLFVIGVSGVVLAYPWATNLIYRVAGSEVPAKEKAPKPDGEMKRAAKKDRHAKDAVRQEAQTASLELDPLWVRAEQQVPGWQIISVKLPDKARGPLSFTIDTGAGGRPDQRSQLTLDRRTAEVIRWEPYSGDSAGRRARNWLRYLHTGEAGGIVGETIAAIVSAGAALLVWTGIALALRRYARWTRRRAPSTVPIAAEVAVER